MLYVIPYAENASGAYPVPDRPYESTPIIMAKGSLFVSLNVTRCGFKVRANDLALILTYNMVYLRGRGTTICPPESITSCRRDGMLSTSLL